MLALLQPISLLALLATLVLLFGFQGQQVIQQPIVIALLAVPILLQVLHLTTATRDWYNRGAAVQRRASVTG